MSEYNCPVGDTCCQGEGETFWLKNPSSLFCSVSPIPHGSLASGERLNALTRFVIYISIIMLISNYKYTKAFLVLSIVFIILIYLTSTKNEREGFASVFDTTNYNVNVEGQYVPNKVYPGSVPNNYSKNLSLPNADRLKPAVDESLIPVYSPNNSTTFGSSDEYLKSTSFNFENGQRDISADIQYFAPKNGVNRRAMISPVIAPRIFDREFFGKESSKISRINDSNITDLTDELDAGQTHGMTNNFPHLADPVMFKSRVENEVYNMNRIGDNNGDGVYTTGQFMDRYPSTVDFDIKHPVSTYSDNPQEMNTVNNMYQNSQMKPNEDVPDNIAKVNKADQVPRKIIEKFDFITLDELDGVKDLSGGRLSQGESINATYSKFNRATPPTNNVVNNQLLQQSPTFVYNDEYFKQPERRVYLQDIQPKLYSFSMDQTPINSNLGITYTPQEPPRFLDQVQNNNMNMPLYTRIDPQLVRTDGTKGQINTQPLRTEYSANYSNYTPAAGSIDFENIYDPRFSSYGDPYRSYSDVNLGQVNYYYSDVDAYRQPNFLQRSNVEFVEFRTPQNDVWSEYNRTASLDDMRPKAVSQYDADDLFHRQDQMEHLMSKMNRESWQQKYMPLRKTNNSSIGPM